MDARLAIYGSFVKPLMATSGEYVSAMAKPAHRTVDTGLRKVLSQNIAALQEKHPHLATSPTLARKAQVGQRTALRAMNGSHATTIDTVHAIARAFGVEAWQLLLPGFGGPEQPKATAPHPDVVAPAPRPPVYSRVHKPEKVRS